MDPSPRGCPPGAQVARPLLKRGPIVTTTADDAIDQELEQTHIRLLLDLVSTGTAQHVFILTPPPADDPE
jgi:hypothetical protein